MTDLPVGWVSAPLKDLGVWVGGGTPSKANPAFWVNGSIPWVSPKDMKVNVLNDAEDHITDDALRASAANLIARGSVLVVTRSGILRHSLPIAVTRTPVSVNQDLKALTPHSGLSAHFIAWALRWQAGTILRDCSKGGTTVQSVETSRLLRFEIPVAPSSEQDRIVAAIEEQFSRLDVGVAALATVRQNLKRMRAAVVEAAVAGRLVPQVEDATVSTALVEQLRREAEEAGGRKGKPVETDQTVSCPASWRLVSLRDLAESITYGTSAKTREDVHGVPVLRMVNLGWGTISYETLKYLPSDQLDTRLTLTPGDLLFNRTNSAELVGKTAVFKGYSEEVAFASYLIRVRPLPSANLEWAALVMNSSIGRRYVASVRTQQVGQANVNGTKLAAAPIPLPSAEEQDRILKESARLFSQIDALDRALERIAARGIHLRASILARAFSGKLVGHDPADEPARVLLERIAAERASSTDQQPAKARQRLRKVTA